MPLVSVLMAAYNREKVIGDAIRSIQNQTFQDWELIIADDGSSDHTLEICRSFEEQDGRIRILVNESNIGVGETRNRLLACSSGKFLAIQDSDDISVPERLAWEIEVLESKPEVGVVSGVEAWKDFTQDRIIWHFPPDLHRGQQYPQDREIMVERLYVNGGLSTAASMFRQSVVDSTEAPFGSYRASEDWYFFIHLAHRTLVWGLPEVLIWIRREKDHNHLMREYVWALTEAQTMKRDIYQFYRDDPESPINYWLYRKSVAPLQHWTGRYLGGWKGYFKIMQSLWWDPFYADGWKSFWEFSERAIQKGKRLTLSTMRG